MEKKRSSVEINSFKDLVEYLWSLRYWIAASLAVAMFVAWVIIKTITPEYSQEIWVMLESGGKDRPEYGILSDLSYNPGAEHFDNEVFILTSPSMMQKVVDELGLNARYFVRKNLHLDEYYKGAPFTMMASFDDGLPESMRPGVVSVNFRHIDDGHFQIQSLKIDGTKVDTPDSEVEYGQVLTVGSVNLTINAVSPTFMTAGARYSCRWNSTPVAASSFVSRLSSSEYQDGRAKNSDVVFLSFKDPCIERARDILNTLIEVGNNEAREYANISNRNTLRFLDDRLTAISEELGNAETRVKNYQASNALVNISSQSEMAIGTDQKNRELLNEINLQIEMVQMVSEYLSGDGEKRYGVIPENVGLNDSGLNNVIHSYNQLVTERERLVASSSENNPRVKSLDAQIDGARASMKATVSNLQRIYIMRKEEIGRNVRSGERKIASIPGQQLQMQNLGRRVDVIEPLFLMLQQKREEVQIAMCSQADSYRVLESAFGSNVPISPDKRKILLTALLIGFFLFPVIFLLRVRLRTKVESKYDIADRLDAPLVAVLSKAEGHHGHLLPQDGRDPCTESFRMLRSNLQYLSGAKVIQVTSSISGEGKSFVASNLAVSLATLDKKVLLLGFDIRKPMLGRIFDVEGSDVRFTFVNYLLGKTDDIDSMVVHSAVNPNLDLIFGGPIPPNPLELLGRCDFKTLFDHFKSIYDFVVVDSAPYFPVADSSIINPYVDATLYVVRCGYTDLKVVDGIKEAMEDQLKPMKNVNIVLNDFSMSNYKYGYGSGAGKYGYGYGYGYGNDDGKKSPFRKCPREHSI